MRVSRRKNMKKWLKAGLKLSGKKRPSDGGMINLLYGDLDGNGGHYQVEHVHDTRFRTDPWVVVYWWPASDPPRGSLSAPYCLHEDDL